MKQMDGFLQNAAKQNELAKHAERKLRQDMHKPMVVQDKKKEQNKKACRKTIER